MSQTNIYELFSKLDDHLFLIDQMIKNAQRSADQDRQTTDTLNKILMDCYMSHPDNTMGPKQGRWSNYSALSDKLEKHLEKYGTSKAMHARNIENLEKMIDQLKSLKSAIASSVVIR